MPQASDVRELQDFANLREQAPELFAGATDDLFSSDAWFATLRAHGFEAESRLRILLARAPARDTSLALPMAGSGELGSLSNYYSCLYGPITAGPEIDPSLLLAIFRHVRGARDKPATLRFAPLDAQGAFVNALRNALVTSGYLADTYFCFGNWYLEVAGRTYAEYFAALPAALRNTILRRERRLSREGAWSVAIHAGTGDGLEASIADFEAVYANSWKGPEPFPRFIPALCRTAAQQGWLRLGVLKLGGRPIAAQLWLQHAGKAMIYKLAYDQACERFSPGSILTAALMRHAIDTDRATEVDYLSGDDAYKREWMSHRRERIGVVAFDPATVGGLVGAARHFSAKRLRAWRRPRVAVVAGDLG